MSDEELYYMRAWCFLKGAFDSILTAMRNDSWKGEECAAEIERIFIAAENFAAEEESL